MLARPFVARNLVLQVFDVVVGIYVPFWHNVCYLIHSLIIVGHCW